MPPAGPSHPEQIANIDGCSPHGATGPTFGCSLNGNAPSPGAGSGSPAPPPRPGPPVAGGSASDASAGSGRTPADRTGDGPRDGGSEPPRTRERPAGDGEQAPNPSERVPSAGHSERGAVDLDLMRRVHAGREGAIGELYDRFGSLVYRMALQMMPNRAEADDAVQEVFVRLWRTADKYDPSKAALVTWVMLLTRRHLVDKLRRARVRPRAGQLSERGFDASAGETSTPSGAGGGEPPGVGEAPERREEFAKLLDLVETLPELQRTVVLRAYLGGQTLRQISDELDTPLGTVKSALSRALVRLRERTEQQGGP